MGCRASRSDREASAYRHVVEEAAPVVSNVGEGRGNCMRINRLSLRASAVLRLARIIVALMLAFGNLLSAPIAAAEPTPTETPVPTDIATPEPTATEAPAPTDTPTAEPTATEAPTETTTPTDVP